MPETSDERVKLMAKWQVWLDGLGAALISPGAPLGKSTTIGRSGIEDGGGANPLSGFTIVEAKDKDAAHGLAIGCPILDNEGTIEVAELGAM